MLQTNPNKRISSKELLYLPIIESKINKNYSKYQELIEKIQKPEIIGTILPQQKELPKNKGISRGNKSRNVSKKKSKSKGKGKKPPSSDRKKKVIDKKYDKILKIRDSSASRKNLDYDPYYNKNNDQKNYDEYSERDYDNKRALHNNYIKEPSFYSKNTSEYNTRDYDNQTHQNYNYNEQPSFYSKITEQNDYSEYNTRDYDNQTHQNYDYNIPPSYNIKNNIERNYNNNNNMDYNDKKNKKNKFYNLLKDSFGPIKKASYYDYDEFRPINNANIYNNYNNYNQIESKNINYNMKPISKYDY